jgi:hypothetical protein
MRKLELKEKKVKIYRLALSRTFPATHPRKGELTHFEEKIKRALLQKEGDLPVKLHTIRAVNPNSKSKSWFEKIEEVNRGEAVLVVYEWNGKPYSKDGCRNLFVFAKEFNMPILKELRKNDKYKLVFELTGHGIKDYADNAAPLCDSVITLPVNDINGYLNKAFKSGFNFAQRWIPVSEEKPEDYKDVLIKEKSGAIYVGWYESCYEKSSRKAWNKQYFKTEEVEFWRPIEYN